MEGNQSISNNECCRDEEMIHSAEVDRLHDLLAQTKQSAALLESNIKFLNERLDKEHGLVERAAELLGDPLPGSPIWNDVRDKWFNDAGMGK